MPTRLLLAVSILIAMPIAALAQKYLRDLTAGPSFWQPSDPSLNAPEFWIPGNREAYLIRSTGQGRAESFLNISRPPNSGLVRSSSECYTSDSAISRLLRLEWPEFELAMLKKKQPLVLMITEPDSVNTRRFASITRQSAHIQKLLEPFQKAQASPKSPMLKDAGIDTTKLMAPYLVVFDNNGKVLLSSPSYRDVPFYQLEERIEQDIRYGYYADVGVPTGPAEPWADE